MKRLNNWLNIITLVLVSYGYFLYYYQALFSMTHTTIDEILFYFKFLIVTVILFEVGITILKENEK
jgi:hypothetical protein